MASPCHQLNHHSLRGKLLEIVSQTQYCRCIILEATSSRPSRGNLLGRAPSRLSLRGNSLEADSSLRPSRLSRLVSLFEAAFQQKKPNLVARSSDLTAIRVESSTGVRKARLQCIMRAASVQFVLTKCTPPHQPCQCACEAACVRLRARMRLGACSCTVVHRRLRKIVLT